MESKIQDKSMYLQNKNRLTDIVNRLVVAKGERRWGGMDWEFGISRYKTSIHRMGKQQVLLYSTRNYIQFSVANHNGKEYEKEYIYV